MQDNPHVHHRSRLRERFLHAGLSDFAAHNVLELLLFYAVPRRDTNAIAHALLQECGSLEAVLFAEPHELCRVAGVGEGIARFLQALREVTALSLNSEAPRLRLPDADALGRYFCELLSGSREGAYATVLLDNSFGVILHTVKEEPSIHSARFSPATVAEEALLSHAPMCAVAHRHTDGLTLPCSEDLDATRLLRDTLDASGIKLLEHFIVDAGRYTTLLYRYSGRYERGEEIPPLGASPEAEAALSDLFSYGHVKADAAALLGAYGGLYPLLSASVARHYHSGLDARTAALLSLPLAVYRYVAGKRPVPASGEGEALGRYLVSLYRGLGEETVMILFFDQRGRHLTTHTVGVGSVGEAGFSCRRIAEGALFSGARQAVLVHNHPQGSLTPSEEDRSATELIAASLGSLGVTLISHYIVAEESFSDFV